MIIKFTNIKLKQSPAGEISTSFTLTEADPSIVPSTTLAEAIIDSSTFTNHQKSVMNEFITILKSKL
jgi:hypothetical protein